MTALRKPDGNLFIPAGPTSRAFLRSKSPIRVIQGPIESGKSVTSAMALYAAICTMPRWKDGKRRSRWLVTRSTYPELRGSTVETFLYWFPPEKYAHPGGGKFYESEPYVYEMRFLDVEADIIFEAYPDDKDETIARLRSKEYTGAWANETQYNTRRLFFEIASRTGRFPPKKELPAGMSLKQWLIADHNAPPTDDHWILRMRGDVLLPESMPDDERSQYAKPDNVEFFHQPPALIERFTPDRKKLLGYDVNPAAENLRNMAPNRYIELTGGRSKAEIDRDLMGRVVKIQVGEPVFPEARRELHVAAAEIPVMPGAHVTVGMDFGRTPTAVFMQQINNRWIVLDEIVCFNKGTKAFAPMVTAKLQERFPDCPYSAWGDPSGGWQGQNDDSTPFLILAAEDIICRAPALKDQPQRRIEAAANCLTTLIDGQPRILIDPVHCPHLIAAVIDGGYVFAVSSAADGTRLIKQPVKNEHSHVAEGWQYGLWGGGEVKGILTPANSNRRTIVSAVPKKRELFKFSRKKR